MNTCLCLEEFITDYPKVQFYTVKKEDEEQSETRKFFVRFGGQMVFKDDVMLIAKVIE